MTWTHDSLADDLASHLLDARRRMVWTDLQLGPAASVRPDVYTLDKSFVRPNPRAYECKVSVSDFRADVTAGKWQNYLAYAQAVTFAVPHGLVSRSDIPNGCGLMVRSERGWATIRKPTLSTLDRIPEEALLKLLIDGCEREFRAYRARQTGLYSELERLHDKIGRDVAAVIQNREAVLRDAEAIRSRAQRELKDAEEIIERRIRDRVAEANSIVEQVRTALGIDDKRRWRIDYAVRERLRRVDRDGEVAHLRAALADAKAALERAERAWPPEAA